MRVAERVLAVFLFSLAAAAVPASAQEQTLALDAGASRVAFHLDATMHSADGTMKVKHGEIRFDLASGAASGEVVIDATSADTESKGRDKKLHHEVLESATYSEIVFHPRSVKADVDESGAGTVTLTGTVAIHGGEHEVSVKAAVSRDGDVVRATGKLVVPYVAWGMHDPSVFVLRVAKQVDVSFTAVGTLAGTPAPPAPEAGR
jgi:polyisoprenoid-binding protein YceI